MNSMACIMFCEHKTAAEKNKSMKEAGGGGSGPMRGGIWEKKHGKNNRKGKLRDQG